MAAFVDDAGQYRAGNVGVMNCEVVVRMAPPAKRIAPLMADLFSWLKSTDQHPLIVSSVFHYEFEFIHPFSDGNGRLGRLWQSLLLAQWNPTLAQLPVESMVYAEQCAYYQALDDSTRGSDSAPFIEFMLAAINTAIEDCEVALTPPSHPPSHPPPSRGAAISTREARRTAKRSRIAAARGVEGSQVFSGALLGACPGAGDGGDDLAREADQSFAALSIIRIGAIARLLARVYVAAARSAANDLKLLFLLRD